MTEAARPSLDRFTPDRPLALLTDYPPDVEGGGAVILRSLIKPEDRASIVWMTPSPMAKGGSPPTGVVTLRSGSAGKGRRSIALDTTVFAGPLAREVLREADARGVAAFWVVMHNAAVPIAARLIRDGRRPVHLTVHDDPAFANALRSTRYFALVPWIDRNFNFSMRHATSIDVIGEAMARRYRGRLGVNSSIVHRAVDGPVAPSGRYDPSVNGLRVGVLGSTYSYEQLPRLARAVELAASRLNVAPRLLIVGRSHGDRLAAEFAGRVQVDVTGHVSEAEAVPMLRACFLLYLNYPFGRRDAVLRQTSFPTKLSTYVQAARPILIHAPSDSSVMPIVGPDGYATQWPDDDPETGAAVIVDAWNRPGANESRHDEADRVRLAYYDPERNPRVLVQALNGLIKPGVER